MNLTILMKESRKRKLLAVGLLCALTLGWNMALASRRQYYRGAIVPVKREDVDIKVHCPGKIEPKTQETVRAELDGAKKAVYVKEGDVVKMGQLLMEISDDQTRTDLQQKKTALGNAQSEYLKAKKDYELDKSLYRQLAVPRREVENAQAAYEHAGQTVQSAKEDLAHVQKKMTGTQVVSPMDGVVLKVMIDDERFISEKKELMKIAQMDKFIVRGQVDELDIAQVALGQPALLRCDAFPDQDLPGQVGWIGAQAGDGTFAEIEVAIDIVDTKNLNLKPNLSCEASILTGHIPQAIVLPADAVRHADKNSFVLKTEWGGWLKETPVDVARITGEKAILKSGLQPGDRVLVPKEE